MRLWIWVAIATFALGAFLITSSEMREATAGEAEFIGTLDQSATLLSGSIRNPHLTAVATDITALGSGTVIVLFVLLASVLLILKRHYFQVAHLVVATVGSALLTKLMKSYFERPRPGTLTHLVDVQGFSYPSGHSLSSAAVYFTFAVLLYFYFQTKLERSLIIGFSLSLILLIAFSRVYLGVHYMSDVIAGVLVGICWASTLAALGGYFETRRRARAF